LAVAYDEIGNTRHVQNTGFTFRLISGSVADGIVQQVIDANQTFVEGPQAGTTEPVPRYELPATFVRVTELGNRLPLSAVEFGAGSRLAGLAVTSRLAWANPYPFTVFVESDNDFTQQVLGFDGSANATINGGSPLPWSVADNWLTIGGRRFARLRVDAATGEERWLGLDAALDQAAYAMEMPVVKLGAQASFAPADLTRVWRSALNVSVIDGDNRFKLLADGSGQQLLRTDSGTNTYALTWTLGSGQRLTHHRTLAAGMERERTWVLLARTGNDLWVLDSIVDTYSDPFGFDQSTIWTPRIVRYTDEGPATP
jgi:hypothetical protein